MLPATQVAEEGDRDLNIIYIGYYIYGWTIVEEFEISVQEIKE
jgi:hypothetical protein